MRLLVVALLAVVACYQPADQPCSIHCTPLDQCPGDQTCGGDGFCHDPGDDTRCVGYTVAITLGGTGVGVVRSSPPGLACDGATGCVATFAAGTEVTLTAAPAALRHPHLHAPRNAQRAASPQQEASQAPPGP